MPEVTAPAPGLARKLGLPRGEAELILFRAPPEWTVPDLPGDVVVRRVERVPSRRRADGDGRVPVVIAFSWAMGELESAIASLAEAIFPDGVLWLAWPRRAGGHESDLTGERIRAEALPLGIVDVKVAALDADWSGLRCVWRRERRR